MRVLQEYDHEKFMSDIIARGWRLTQAWKEANAVRAAQAPPQPPLSYDAVCRFLRGESHSLPVANALAVALGKTEAEYRKAAAPPKRSAGGRRRLAAAR